MRARLKDRVLGPEWLKQIAAMKYDDPFTLPSAYLDCRFRMRRSFGRCDADKGISWSHLVPTNEKQQVSPGATMKRAARKATRYGRGLAGL